MLTRNPAFDNGFTERIYRRFVNTKKYMLQKQLHTTYSMFMINLIIIQY